MASGFTDQCPATAQSSSNTQTAEQKVSRCAQEIFQKVDLVVVVGIVCGQWLH